MLQGSINRVLQVMFCYPLAVFAEIKKPIIDRSLVENLLSLINQKGFRRDGGLKLPDECKITVHLHRKLNGVFLHKRSNFIRIDFSGDHSPYAKLARGI